jgi:MFS family permease
MADAPVESTRRALATVFVIVFVDLVGFGILLPIIPLYAESFGASELVVGVLIASYSMTQFLAAPILGRLSDERGRRPILLLSLLGSVIAWTLFGLAGSLFVLFAARLLAGAMGGNIATAQAYIADVTPPEDRAKGLGLVGAAFGLGFVFGPALGGIFASPSALALARDLLPALVPVTEFSLPSFAAAAITALNLVAAFFALPETNPGGRSTPDARGRLERLTDALTDPALGGLVGAFFLFSFAFSAMESMFVLLTKDLYGYGPTMNGYVLAYVGVVIAIVQGGLVGRLTDLVGEKRLALVGLAIELVALASLPFAPVLGTLLPAVGPLSSGLLALLVVLTPLAGANGLANVSLTTLVSTNASDEEQGGAFGLTQSAGSIARAAGPIAAGALYAGIAYWAPFVAAGLMMAPIIYVVGTRVTGATRTSPA